MSVLVSIAIATYNGEQFLEEQLNSIYSQTYKNFEVVVADDASEDKTVEILDKYEKLFGLIYSVNQKRLGVVKNFETAVAKCKGKYILLSDQDDVWLPNKINQLLENIGNASLIYSDGIIYHGENEIKPKRISNEKWISLFGTDSSNKDFLKYTLLNSFILGCSMMFDREILEDAIPFYESNLNHDWWLVLCAQNKKGIKYLNEVLFKYRIHESNFSMLQAKGKKSMYKRLVLFFWFETLPEVQEKKVLIKRMLNQFKNSFENRFFSDLLMYSNSKRAILNIKGFWNVLKYRKFFFPNFSPFRRSCAVLISLIK